MTAADRSRCRIDQHPGARVAQPVDVATVTSTSIHG
jgi:hypothetical protein